MISLKVIFVLELMVAKINTLVVCSCCFNQSVRLKTISHGIRYYKEEYEKYL